MDCFINKYNSKERNFALEKDDWKNIEKNIVTIARNILYAKKEKNMSCLYLKTNSNGEKQVILLIILNGEGFIILQSQYY